MGQQQSLPQQRVSRRRAASNTAPATVAPRRSLVPRVKPDSATGARPTSTTPIAAASTSDTQELTPASGHLLLQLPPTADNAVRRRQSSRMLRCRYDTSVSKFTTDRQQRGGRASNGVNMVLSQQKLTELPAQLFAGPSSSTDSVDDEDAVWRAGDIHWLDVSHNALRELPAEIASLTNLVKLACGYNELTAVPPEIGQLTQLTWLDLTHNHIDHVSDALGELTNLTGLGLSDCRLQQFPASIGKLHKLAKLGLFNNMIESIPGPALRHLTSLTKLDLSNNLLQTLPEEIGCLTSLTWLNLGYNRLKTLPPQVNQLLELRELGLGHNQLTSLPDLSALQNLAVLPAFNNRLTAIGPWICRLRALEKLDLSGNQLQHIPSHVYRLPRLVHLNLKKNRLRQLDCSFMRMTVRPLQADAPAALHVSVISKLTFLDLSDNELHSVPYDLSRLPSLSQFRILRNPLDTPMASAQATGRQQQSPPSLRSLCMNALLTRHAPDPATSTTDPGARQDLSWLPPMLRDYVPPHLGRYFGVDRVCDHCQTSFVVDEDFAPALTDPATTTYLRHISFLPMQDNHDVPFVRQFCSRLCWDACAPAKA
ncbi:protein ubiquitination [Sorochytrium milnesiophthora]